MAIAKDLNAVRHEVSTDLALPFNLPSYAIGNHYFVGSYMGRKIYLSEEVSERISIAQIARQCPELDVEWNTADVQEAADCASDLDPFSLAGGTEIVDGFWSFGGLEMNETALFDMLVELLGLGEEDAERMPDPLEIRMLYLSEIKLANKHGLAVSITENYTKIGDIELNECGVFVKGDATHATLYDAIHETDTTFDLETA